MSETRREEDQTILAQRTAVDMMLNVPEADSHYEEIQADIKRLSQKDPRIERMLRLSKDTKDESAMSALFFDINRQFSLVEYVETLASFRSDFDKCCEIVPERIVGVDGKPYVRPKWEDLYWTPDLLDHLKVLENPRLIVAPMAQSAETTINPLKAKGFGLYKNWDLNSDQANIPEQNQRRMEFMENDPLNGRTKLQILGEKDGGGFDFGGFEVVVMDGGQQCLKSTYGKSAIQLTRTFIAQGFELPTPEAYALAMKIAVNEGKPLDEEGVTWLKGYLPEFSAVPRGYRSPNSLELYLNRNQPVFSSDLHGGRRSARVPSKPRLA